MASHDQHQLVHRLEVVSLQPVLPLLVDNALAQAGRAACNSHAVEFLAPLRELRLGGNSSHAQEIDEVSIDDQQSSLAGGSRVGPIEEAGKGVVGQEVLEAV